MAFLSINEQEIPIDITENDRNYDMKLVIVRQREVIPWIN